MQENITLLPGLKATVKSLPINSITKPRRSTLHKLIDYIQEKLTKGEAIKLNFICTHNSRRSQFAQIWAQTAAHYYGIPVTCYSGGVEVTALHANAIAAIKRAGFKVSQKGRDNPVYFIFHSKDAQPISAFSKVYDDPVNAISGFAAIMTCADADENCPFIPGADARIAIPYEDPKNYDNTPEEAGKYDERSTQIAAEMFYVFSQLKT